MVDTNIQKELIEESVLKHLNQIFLYQIELYPKVPHKGAFETIKNRYPRAVFSLISVVLAAAAFWQQTAHLSHKTIFQISFWDLCRCSNFPSHFTVRIENVYKVMLEKMGEKAFVWSFYSDYLNLVIEYSILSTQHKVTRLKK